MEEKYCTSCKAEFMMQKSFSFCGYCKTNTLVKKSTKDQVKKSSNKREDSTKSTGRVQNPYYINRSFRPGEEDPYTKSRKEKVKFERKKWYKDDDGNLQEKNNQGCLSVFLIIPFIVILSICYL